MQSQGNGTSDYRRKTQRFHAAMQRNSDALFLLGGPQISGVAMISAMHKPPFSGERLAAGIRTEQAERKTGKLG
jgi:hypothetical protein